VVQNLERCEFAQDLIMASHLGSELEQESYEPEEFVERLAWRATTASSSGSDDIGSEISNAFIQAIRDLNVMQEKQKKKCLTLEQVKRVDISDVVVFLALLSLLFQKCRDEESGHRKRTAGLIERNRATAATYKSLDEKINSVATKVVHLGDQLESVNTPRSRAVEALKLMKHFEDFVDGETSTSPVFTDKKRLHEAADIIQKLQLTAQELPNTTPEFSQAKRRIDAKYSEVESALIEEFVKSHRSNDKQRMKDLALILSGFKSYNACVDAFIEQQVQLQKQPSQKKTDLFKETVPLCESSWKVIEAVFPNPQQVMAKLVLNIYHSRLKEHIGNRLADKSAENFLSNLFQLYSSTTKLTAELSKFNLGSDHLFLSNLTKTIFRGYLESYINIECRYLNDRCAVILQRYYDKKGHQKKVNLSGGAAPLQDLKRDLHGFIASKAHINIEMLSYGGETFLSEEVAINILQLTKEAFRRCQVLSNSKDLAGNAVEVFGILVSYLLHEHVDYALEIGLLGIPLPECKTIPEVFFFDVVGQTNAIIHLLEKQFNDSLVPLVASTPKHADCLTKKKNELEILEKKVDAGLDRSLNALVGWVRTILTTEQRKSDFNPPIPSKGMSAAPPTTSTTACVRVVKFVNYQVDKIKESLDGKNIELVLYELGTRLHRVIYDHLQQFTYSSAGVMAVICDVQVCTMHCWVYSNVRGGRKLRSNFPTERE
jgi:hypothetical protein